VLREGRRGQYRNCKVSYGPVRRLCTYLRLSVNTVQTETSPCCSQFSIKLFSVFTWLILF